MAWNLESNITVAGGNCTWNPHGIHEALTSANNTLSADKAHYFEARLHNANRTDGANIDSHKYEVEGYENIVSGGDGMQQSLLDARGALLGATTGAFVVVMAWCL